MTAAEVTVGIFNHKYLILKGREMQSEVNEWFPLLSFH